MSTVLEQPATPVMTDVPELVLASGDGEQLQATRYVFLAADLMDPERSRNIGMPNGGEEAESRCLRRTSGRIPRCFLTPLELSVEYMPLDLFPTGMEQFALSPKLTPEDTNGIPQGKIFKPLFGYPYYPGHQIIDVTDAGSMSRGKVEVENLRGVDYGPDVEQLQYLFFPADWPLPVELNTIEQRIETVALGVADPDVKDTANFMLRSTALSREYLETMVSIANTQLDQRVISGPGYSYTFRLTPKIRHFMAQLGMKPRAEVQVQDAVSQAVNNSLSPEVLAQLQASNAELVSGIVAGIGPAIADAVSKAIAATLEANKATKPTKA